MGERTSVAVLVKRVPVRLFLASQDHQNDLVRELQLIALSGADAQGLPRELAERMSTLLGRYNDVRQATRRQAEAALAAGRDTVDLEVPVAPGMPEALERWLGLLDEVDRYCADGSLLTLASPPEIQELRRWYAAEILAQLRS